jgi:hypothetical protein
MTTYQQQKLGNLISVKHGWAFEGRYFVDVWKLQRASSSHPILT